jgi:hypothetical protein
VIDDDVRAHLGCTSLLEMIEYMCQLAEPELRGSTTAARVLRQANGCFGFGRHARSVAA